MIRLRSETTLDRSSFQSPKWLFWIALAVRVAVVLIGRTYRSPHDADHFNFAFEIGRIAQSLVEDRGFGSPFGGNTGPTAWIMPVYPLLLAAVFKIGGVYTALSAGIMHCIDSVFASFTALAVYEIGTRVFGRRVGIWSGWIWALYPGTIQYPIHWIWDMSLVALCFALMLVQVLRMGGVGDDQLRFELADWMRFGLFWGLLILVNPTTLFLLPATALWLLWIYWKQVPSLPAGALRQLAGIALSALVCMGVMSPWVIRNALVFHAFIPTRGNLGAELADAWSDTWHGFPAQGQRVGILPTDRSHKLYAELGEVVYVRERGKIAQAWLHRDPWRVLVREPLLRVDMFWAGVPHAEDRHPWMERLRELNFAFLSVTGLLGVGLAIRSQVRGAALFGWSCLLMPATYYFITVAPRFRHPLEVVLIVSTTYLFSQAEPRWGFSRMQRFSQPNLGS